MTIKLSTRTSTYTIDETNYNDIFISDTKYDHVNGFADNSIVNVIRNNNNIIENPNNYIILNNHDMLQQLNHDTRLIRCNDVDLEEIRQSSYRVSCRFIQKLLYFMTLPSNKDHVSKSYQFHKKVIINDTLYYGYVLKNMDNNHNLLSYDSNNLTHSNNRCYGCVACDNCDDCIGCEKCDNCDDCTLCIECENCNKCVGCDSCKLCEYCKVSINSRNCKGITQCERCNDCHGMLYCNDCSDCSACIACYDCKDCAYCQVLSLSKRCFQVYRCKKCIECCQLTDCEDKTGMVTLNEENFSKNDWMGKYACQYIKEDKDKSEKCGCKDEKRDYKDDVHIHNEHHSSEDYDYKDNKHYHDRSYKKNKCITM